MPGCAIAAIPLPPAGRFETKPTLYVQGTMFSKAADHSVNIQVLGVNQLPGLNAPDISLDATSKNC